jgi:guanyl-specific ribonuclease Sa
VYIAAHSRLRQADVAEIRLGQTIVLLLRPGRAWPVELARQRLDARRVASVLHGFRQRPLAVAQLRSFWHYHHLAGRQLSDEALLVEFATAIEGHRIEALVLPLRHGAVSSVSAAASGEAGIGPTRAPPTASATPARTTVGLQPPVPVAQWDIRRRLAYVLPKAAEDVPGEALRSIILGLATPEGIAALVLVIGLEVASHAAGGVGFFADAALVAVLWTMCGVSAFYAMIAFRDFLIHTIEARTDRDLDVAARDLADAAVLLGTAALTFLGGWVKAKTAAGRVGGTGAGEASSASADSSGGRVQGSRTRTVRQADERPVMEPSTSAVPQRVRAVADAVRQTGQPMPGYKGGRVFRNDARGGGQQLPSTDAVGNGISYREWDVNPLRPGFDRGPQRVVTGSDGSAYYTEDHYQTFVPIK